MYQAIHNLIFWAPSTPVTHEHKIILWDLQHWNKHLKIKNYCLTSRLGFCNVTEMKQKADSSQNRQTEVRCICRVKLAAFQNGGGLHAEHQKHKSYCFCIWDNECLSHAEKRHLYNKRCTRSSKAKGSMQSANTTLYNIILTSCCWSTEITGN